MFVRFRAPQRPFRSKIPDEPTFTFTTPEIDLLPHLRRPSIDFPKDSGVEPRIVSFFVSEARCGPSGGGAASGNSRGRAPGPRRRSSRSAATTLPQRRRARRQRRRATWRRLPYTMRDTRVCGQRRAHTALPQLLWLRRRGEGAHRKQHQLERHGESVCRGGGGEIGSEDALQGRRTNRPNMCSRSEWVRNRAQTLRCSPEPQHCMSERKIPRACSSYSCAARVPLVRARTCRAGGKKAAYTVQVEKSARRGPRLSARDAR